MSQAIWWRRLARRIWPHGALARRSDRVEGLLIAGCVTMALLLVPVAGAIASEVNAAEQEQAVQQARERHPVNAVLLADAPAAGAYSWSESLARWTGADGKPVQATIRTTPGTRAGSPVTAW